MKRKSFTIIEILISMVIMGTLSATLVPRIWDAKEKANDTLTKINTNRSAACGVDGLEDLCFDNGWGGTQNLGNWVHHIWTDITVCREWNCITMQDRNLWASEAWTWVASYWYHFQWWNNHWFLPGENRSDTFPWWENIWDTRVTNCANYWPAPLGRYDSNTFIMKDFADWCNPSNDNLRWWKWDSSKNNRWLNSTNSIADRQWPCPDWYHVPSIWEWNKVLEYWAEENGIELENVGGLKYNQTTLDGLKFQEDFKIPFAGYRYYIANVYKIGDDANLWSSSPNAGDEDARQFYLSPDGAYAAISHNRIVAFSMRCFKD